MLAVKYGTPAQGNKKENGDSPTPPTPVLLWTNPDPSSSFAEQDVTLSDSVANYSKMRVEFYRTTTDRAYLGTFDFPVMLPDNSDYMYATGASKLKIALSWWTSGSDAYARQGAIKSDTVFHFFANRRINTSGTTNTHMIPYKLYGIR